MRGFLGHFHVVIERPDGERQEVVVPAGSIDEAATPATAGEPEGTRVVRYAICSSCQCGDHEQHLAADSMIWTLVEIVEQERDALRKEVRDLQSQLTLLDQANSTLSAQNTELATENDRLRAVVEAARKVAEWPREKYLKPLVQALDCLDQTGPVL